MTNSIKIRVPLPLYGSNSRADLILEMVDLEHSFDLQPIRYFRPADGVPESSTQWHLSTEKPVRAKIEIQLTPGQVWSQTSFNVPLPLEVGLGRARQSDPFFALYGAISIPLTFTASTSEAQPLKQLWLTGDLQEISELVIEPSGLYLRGLLPPAFYIQKQKPVTLRVPQTPEDVVSADDLLHRAFSDLNLARMGRFWSLSAVVFEDNLNAIAHVRNCAARFESFRLPSEESRWRLDTFLDNVECQPSSDCLVQFFREEDTTTPHKFIKQIYWIAQYLNTRISIGGNVAAEANFQPQFLTGQLQRSQSSDPWLQTQLQFESARTQMQLPEVSLTLRGVTPSPISAALQIPGVKGQPIGIVIKASRHADFTNEFGLFQVDDERGKIGTLLPGDRGYPRAALARKLFTLKPDEDRASLELPGGTWTSGYLIQNGTSEAWLRDNPDNQVSVSPLAFFSFEAANPDREPHVRQQQASGGVQMAWEDQILAAGRDFDDLVVTLQLKRRPIEFQLREIQVQAISMPACLLQRETTSSQPTLANRYRSWLCTTTGWLAIDSTAREAKIDPRSVTQGVIFGAIELDKLVWGLQTTEDTPIDNSLGVEIQMQTLKDSRVAVKLTQAEGFEELTLELSDFVTTVRTPSVWLKDRLVDAVDRTSGLNPRVIPSLAAGNTDPAKLQEKLLQERSPAVFVSTNALDLSSSENPSGASVAATIAYQIGSDNFQFRFPHGRVFPERSLNHNQLPLFKLNQNLQPSLDRNEIDPSFKQFFQEQGYPLSANSTLLSRTFNSQASWLILDLGNNLGYIIHRASDELNVYPTPWQALLVWHLPADYPVVQSFPLSPTDLMKLGGIDAPDSGSSQGSFLDSNRGLIPYQPQSEISLEVQFPQARAGLPQCSPHAPIAGEDLTGVTPWQLVADLLTSRYFLPTLPGVEIDLSDRLGQWIYRHSVPVLDESYAEASESQSNRFANTGNLQGRDLTRIEGTKAFTLLPPNSPGKATGWLPKTIGNLEGAVNIEVLSLQLRGRQPEISVRLSNQKTDIQPEPSDWDQAIQVNFKRDLATSGGLSLPLRFQTESKPENRLPLFSVGLGPESQLLGTNSKIQNNGQPLLALFEPSLQRIVTLDGEGLVQEEPIGSNNSYRLRDKEERTRITKSFHLLSELQLEVIGVPLGRFSPSEDLDCQSWMLHDGKGDWARLGGFPLYPLRLLEISESGETIAIQLEAVWLYEPPATATINRPSNAGEKIWLTFAGKDADWQLSVAGQIDWHFPQQLAEADSRPHLVRLQGKIEQQEPSRIEEFNLESVKVSIAHPAGLMVLTAPPEATCQMLPNGRGLVLEIPTTSQGNFQYRLGKTYIQPDRAAPSLNDYEFTWIDSTPESSDRKTTGKALLIPGPTGQPIGIAIKASRHADFTNEFGLFQVDDERGQIGTLLPGDRGYPRAALARKLFTLKPDEDRASLELPGGTWTSGYLIQNGTSEAWLRDNPDNQVNVSPLAFFSFEAANPDREPHVRQQQASGGVQMAWEDQTLAAGRDFDDLVVTLQFKQTPAVPQLQWKLEYRSSLSLQLQDISNWQALATALQTQVQEDSLSPGKIIWRSSPAIRNIIQSHPDLDESARLDFLKALSDWLPTALDLQDLESWTQPLPVPASVLTESASLTARERQLYSRLLLEVAFPESIAPIRPIWHLAIGSREDDLVTRALVSLSLTQHRVEPHKFILVADRQQAPIVPLALGDNSWFERLDEHPDRGLVGVEFGGFSLETPQVKSLVADLQLRLTNKGSQKTRLVLRLRLNLTAEDEQKRFEVEATGQIWLENAIAWQTNKVPAVHQLAFYFDRAQLTAPVALAFLQGRGPEIPGILGGIGDHRWDFGNGIVYHWQAPQTMRLMQLSQAVKTFLGTPNDRPTEFVFFESNESDIRRAEQINLLTKVLNTLQNDLAATADIKGYTDSSGSSTVNLTVSQQRANAASKWLQDRGIDSQRLQAEGLGETNPRGDNGTPVGRAQNRRVEIIIHTLVFPQIPPDSESHLVIEAGTVFELKDGERMAESPVVPDLDNGFVRLGLRSRSLVLSDRVESHIVRLPVIACSLADRGLPIWPAIELVKPSTGLVYRTTDVQKPFLPPVLAAESDLGSSLAIFNRRPQARWLESAYLRQAIVWQPEPQMPAIELQPAFLNRDRVTLHLPSNLGDLEWLRANSADNSVRELTAATLVTTAYDPDDPKIPVLTGPTRFEYPFAVVEIAADFSLPPAATVDVQLIVLANGTLERIARDRLDKLVSPAAIKQWARNWLQTKGRYAGAIVLQDFDRMAIAIPRPFEGWREELVDVPNWFLAPTESPLEIAGADLDPRCRLPGGNFVLKPEPSLGLLALAADPQIPPEAPQIKSVAATRFRLAPTGGRSEKFAGKLRPAQIPLANPDGVLGCHKWDAVSFEECNSTGNLSPYPKVNSRAIAVRPFITSPLPEPPDGKIGGITTLLPPLVDVVAWASRPGEMTRSLWSLNCLSSPKTEGISQVAVAQSVAVSLRRPRAVAGLGESARIQIEERQVILNQFYYARLLMTQALGTTSLPEDGRVYGVVAGRNNFYQSSNNLALAASSTALFYKEEVLTFYLVASENFIPNSQDSHTPPQQVAQTVLLWSEAKDSSGKDLSISDLPDAPGGVNANFKQQILIADLKSREQEPKSWKPLFPNTYVLNLADVSSTRIPSSNSNAYILLVKYVTDDLQASPVVWKPEIVFAVFLSFLESGSAIVAPKLAVALLSVPSEPSKEQILLSGFGRLDDRDFSPIQPIADREAIEWMRTASLHALDRIDLQVLGNPPYSYDLVLYGSGGELIATKV